MLVYDIAAGPASPIAQLSDAGGDSHFAEFDPSGRHRLRDLPRRLASPLWTLAGDRPVRLVGQSVAVDHPLRPTAERVLVSDPRLNGSRAP